MVLYTIKRVRYLDVDILVHVIDILTTPLCDLSHILCGLVVEITDGRETFEDKTDHLRRL